MFIPNWAYIQEWGGAIFEMLIGLHIWGTYIWGGGGGGLFWGGGGGGQKMVNRVPLCFSLTE